MKPERMFSDSKRGRISLYAGMDLSYLNLPTDRYSIQHGAPGRILQIHYCRAGQAVWGRENDSCIFLNPGDFSVHTLDAGTDFGVHFPTGRYQGLTITLDLREACAHPPELLAQTGVLERLQRKTERRSGAAVFFAGTGQTESIFSAFYDQPENLRLSYQRIKTLELLLYLAQTEDDWQNRLTEYPSEQVELVRRIHDQLLRHIDRRVTIEALSKQYLINPTTLKTAFKDVYGTSLAAHIKQHRMELAAKLLRETDISIAGIAQTVGYDSQSKFAAAFKDAFQVLPREYRKRF